MSRRRIVVGGEKPPQATPVSRPVEVAERPVALPPQHNADWSAPRIATLVAQIRKDPEADPPREVLADVLEQAGEAARAELVQLQLKRASLPSWDVQVVEIELRERALLAAYDEGWRAELPVLPGVTWGPFARGFVETVAFETFDAFVEHADACFEAAPIRGIAIPWPRSNKRAEVEPIPHLRELTVHGTSMSRQDLEWLAAQPLLSTLRSLTFLDSELENISALFKSPHLSRLETLSLPLSRLDDDSIYRLINATLPELAAIELTKVDPVEEYGGSGQRTRRVVRRQGTSYAAKALAGWAGFANIRRLDLTGTKLGSAGLTALVQSPHSKGLKTLVVRDIVFRRGEDPMDAFAAARAVLDELDVSDNDLDAHGATCMAESRALQELAVLRIERVVSAHFARLAQATWLDSLRVLACGQSAVLPMVKRAPQQLHTLRVTSDGKPASDVVKHLRAAPLPALRKLDLSNCGLTDEDLASLGTLDTLPNLVALQLGGKRLTRAGIEAFVRSPLAASLVSIETGFATLDRLPARSPVVIGHGPYQGPRRFLS